MRTPSFAHTLLLAFAWFVSCAGPSAPAGSVALPSWNDGPSRQAILSFVEGVCEEGGERYLPPAERIAVFDKDGTLWSEQPIYVQLAFIQDRLRALAPEQPRWQEREPFRSALAGDLAGALKGGEPAIAELVAATHAGTTSEEFALLVREWLASARHPLQGRPYTELVYQPMLELLDFLRENGFKTFIVSGGGIEFVRAFAEEVYGIPPEQVVGSSIAARYELQEGQPVIRRLPELGFVDDGAEKPVGIQLHIGRRPVLAFGNSDGDFEMLEWTAAGQGARLCALLHHDDEVRETAYDRDGHVGKLARGLDEASARGWLVVSMERDWKTVFPSPR